MCVDMLDPHLHCKKLQKIIFVLFRYNQTVVYANRQRECVK